MEHKTHISEPKKKALKELVDLIKSSKSILIASIKDIPASQIQEISKKLRGKAEMRISKKNLVFRAIDASGNKELEKLKDKIKDNVAILFSNLDSFELASELIESKRLAKAKIGQEAPEDIEVPAGPTELVPGPAISELGAVGIKIIIEGGKITIKDPKVIVKKGQKISAGAADIMNKLGIKPFSISLTPVAAFDIAEGKLYSNIKIDREKTINDLKAEYAKALAFAVEIGYITGETIKFMIAKAGREEKALENFVNIHIQGGNEQ
ncbi:MAG TPA: 50S ribosomal protein L10 [Patescibacteria group bacterium]|nr:50S ribosomal protein L10 [Patescibacteria group bacterium]